MITQDVRRAIAQALAAEGFALTDPGLRPGGRPGCYASSAAFAVGNGRAPRDVARLLAARLAEHPWLARAEVSGPGFLALAVTPDTLAALPARIAAAGPACARSDVLSGVTVEAPAPVDLLAAAGWEQAREALAAELTARLAAAAGATVAVASCPERTVPPQKRSQAVAAAVAFAGADSVRFALATAVPGRPVRIDATEIARHVPANPAYAVRYAHARAASGVRWAATLGAEAVPWRLPADPGDLALLDALSWLPERVAVAARRGRPDEYARYLEELAGVTIATLSSASRHGRAGAPGSDRLTLAGAAETGLAAGLELLGVSAPDRL